MDIPGAWHREVLYDLGRPAVSICIMGIRNCIDDGLVANRSGYTQQRVTRTPQELERQRDQSVAFTAVSSTGKLRFPLASPASLRLLTNVWGNEKQEEIAEEFERLWQEHLARIERGEESEDELAG